MCTTGRLSELIQDLQYTLGEGPCIDAHRLGRPVVEPDLAHPAVRRWAAFSGPAVDAGVRAVFAFPMVVGGVHLGAVDLYADRPGPLTDDQHADALVMAGMAAEAVLSIQADGSTGVLEVGHERSSDFQHVVHQAAGMVSVQLDVSVAVALLRLRSYAFGHQRLLADVAADVVARTLRFSQGGT
jgi:GAF domain-containing protein